MTTQKTSKCLCGNRTVLCYRDTPARVGTSIVIIKYVPTYICDHCREEILSGPTSLKIAERAKFAVENDLDEIEF